MTIDRWRRLGLLHTRWYEGHPYVSRQELENLLALEAASWRQRPGAKPKRKTANPQPAEVA